VSRISSVCAPSHAAQGEVTITSPFGERLGRVPSTSPPPSELSRYIAVRPTGDHGAKAGAQESKPRRRTGGSGARVSHTPVPRPRVAHTHSSCDRLGWLAFVRGVCSVSMFLTIRSSRNNRSITSRIAATCSFTSACPRRRAFSWRRWIPISPDFLFTTRPSKRGC